MSHVLRSSGKESYFPSNVRNYGQSFSTLHLLWLFGTNLRLALQYEFSHREMKIIYDVDEPTTTQHRKRNMIFLCDFQLMPSIKQVCLLMLITKLVCVSAGLSEYSVNAGKTYCPKTDVILIAYASLIFYWIFCLLLFCSAFSTIFKKNDQMYWNFQQQLSLIYVGLA